MAIQRLFVRKRDAFANEAAHVLATLQQELHVPATAVQIYERYDVENLSDDALQKAKHLIFSEPPVDLVAETLDIPANAFAFAIEYVPGQYDQRADSAEQCISMLTLTTGHTVRCARVFVIEGTFTDEEKESIKQYYINPVDSREASLELPDTLALKLEEPEDVAIIDDFTEMSDDALQDVISEYGLAMTLADIKLIQKQYKNVEKRNPTITEIRLFDTYWSDHCRHTTFMTELTDITIEESRFTEPIKEALEEYTEGRNLLYTTKVKARSLMDMATLAVKELRHAGGLTNLDESEEINACTIIVPVDVDGKEEEWLLLFKNETHNHPTEIEPFGGAATCLGGCIRDPLSGRSYVYQAMRITGSGDPRTPLADTLEGKLPQKKITVEAARGYSSYGNQIGLATGEVKEYYHPGYVAKRMEIGAVIGAAPRNQVRREVPTPGDIIVLLGGKTGRDGCGGATGSSKEHTLESLATCGAEVQKGNALTERKIQRLFRRPEVTTLIKRCNDFGAGGVSVAIGELTDGVTINLDLVPKKYDGLDGTELAISESQERMACAIDAENKDRFIELAGLENLQATHVATVTDTGYLRMFWNGKAIVDLNRAFLDTNGKKQQTNIHVPKVDEENTFFNNGKIKAEGETISDKFDSVLKDLNVCSQKGLVEKFDNTIGSNTVLLPFGGKYQRTPIQGMVAKIPVLDGKTTTSSIMTFGYNPKIGKWSPFHGALYAVVESICKLVAVGGDYKTTRLTFQEYFEKLGKDKTKWGKPFSALLGAYYAQKQFEIPAIGGKDSMSGTFEHINVPPTLVSFAVDTVDAEYVVSQEFKKAGSVLAVIKTPTLESGIPDFDILKKNLDKIRELTQAKKVLASYALGYGGLGEAIAKMAFGNKIGFEVAKDVDADKLFDPAYGNIALEMDKADLALLEDLDYKVAGKTIEGQYIDVDGYKVCLGKIYKAYESTLEPIFPTKAVEPTGEVKNINFIVNEHQKSSLSIAQPKVFIPSFPGTNCEYDSARAFEDAGAKASIKVFRNLNYANIEDSIETMVKEIESSQIVMIPGGFSAGDEPDGSAKFIATVFRNPRIAEAVNDLLTNRDGLMLGICNGFQALIKLGLVPYGEIKPVTAEDAPTITYNNIGRHQAKVVTTRIASNKSPWLSGTQVGDLHSISISHGEGKFVANKETFDQLVANGQIATQYVDLDGNATYDIDYNPNGSFYAVEGITSADGRILGKMGHSERIGKYTLKNIHGEKDQKIFESGVNYFK